MIIRSAIESDIPDILKMAKTMHSESRFRNFDFNEEKLSSVAISMINSEFGILLVAEDKKIFGGIMGIVAEHYFGHDKTASDLGLFVNPDKRNSKAVIGLIKTYISKAKEMGAVDIMISNTTGYEYKSVGRLYEHIGFTQIGGNYCLGELNV